jgi:hypothetical protein
LLRQQLTHVSGYDEYQGHGGKRDLDHPKEDSAAT